MTPTMPQNSPIVVPQFRGTLADQWETRRVVARPARDHTVPRLDSDFLASQINHLAYDLLATVGSPAWLREFNANAARVRALLPGWDGPGSVGISAVSLFIATKVTRRALEARDHVVAPYIVPAGDGSVQIEWHQKHGELELDIDIHGGLFIWLRDHRTGAEYEGSDDKALNLFFRWAPWMASVAGHENDVPLPASGPPICVAA